MQLLSKNVYGSSPLTRGTPRLVCHGHRKARFIPAYAGNSNSAKAQKELMAVHPRLRGELVFWFSYSQPCLGSSPLTRGTLDDEDGKTSYWRFIPAYAGNSEPLLKWSAPEPVHPRLRGELSNDGEQPQILNGSSPLTRGTRFKIPRYYDRLRFIPAYAGNSVNVTAYSFIFSVHPRLRGELT